MLSLRCDHGLIEVHVNWLSCSNEAILIIPRCSIHGGNLTARLRSIFYVLLSLLACETFI